jgi:hypothetical protein
MEGWRQWQLGREKNLVQQTSKRTNLTPTGLLMEGDYTNYPSMSEMAVYRQQA